MQLSPNRDNSAASQARSCSKSSIIRWRLAPVISLSAVFISTLIGFTRKFTIEFPEGVFRRSRLFSSERLLKEGIWIDGIRKPFPTLLQIPGFLHLEFSQVGQGAVCLMYGDWNTNVTQPTDFSGPGSMPQLGSPLIEGPRIGRMEMEIGRSVAADWHSTPFATHRRSIKWPEKSNQGWEVGARGLRHSS